MLDLVQQGMSEKVALVVNFIAAFVTGFVLAYARSWRLALALTAILPCIGITGAFMNKFLSKYMQYVFITFLMSFHESWLQAIP
jgi:ATP-binding cassette subfamily B (MDR/TAP) protein 1